MRGVVALGLLVMGCSKDPDPFVISVRGPLQTKAFAPPVTRVELRVRASDGAERLISRVDASSGGLEVPDDAKSGIGSLVLAGLDSAGAILEYGRTPSLELSGLSGRATLPLAVLVQKKGTIANAFALQGSIVAPRCATIGARYAVIADAEKTTADVVDLLDLQPKNESAFGGKPVTLAIAGGRALTIDEAGVATLIDLDRATTTTPKGAFAEVNGGAVIVDDRGGAWIVGATRKSSPSDVVLRLDPDGTIATRKLLRARTSAAAAWVAGRGLVVAYGSSPSMDEAGLEIIAPDATASVALPFPSDHRAAGVIVPGTSGLLRIDENGVATTIDLACATACMPQPSPLTDDKRAPRADDHVTMLEGGSALIVRGGRILHLTREGGDKLTLLHDAGANPVCSVALSTGNAAVMVGGESVLRTVRP
jgi:hypothetical protein